MKMPETKKLPTILIPYMSFLDRLPNHERPKVQEYLDNVQKERVAKKAFAIWQKERVKGTHETLGNRVLWRQPSEDIKEEITAHPMTALRCYLEGPEWWTQDELVEVVSHNPATSYWAARKTRIDKRHIPKLQLATGRGRPDLIYHFVRDIAGASLELAKEQLEPFPYWRLQIEEDDRSNLEKTVESLAFECPEAASYILFRSKLCLDSNELARMAMEALQLHPDWAYETAKRLAKDKFEDDWRWEELKTICLRSPQWAFHWAQAFEKENAGDFISACWNHPGWAAELLNLMDRTSSASETQSALQKICARNQHIFNGRNMWQLGFLLWSIDDLQKRWKKPA